MELFQRLQNVLSKITGHDPAVTAEIKERTAEVIGEARNARAEYLREMRMGAYDAISELPQRKPGPLRSEDK